MQYKLKRADGPFYVLTREIPTMKIDFSQLNKQSKRSFSDQHAVIKKVMQGKIVACEQCRQPLMLITPEQSEQPGIGCLKGCTFISLEFS